MIFSLKKCMAGLLAGAVLCVSDGAIATGFQNESIPFSSRLAMARKLIQQKKQNRAEGANIHRKNTHQNKQKFEDFLGITDLRIERDEALKQVEELKKQINGYIAHLASAQLRAKTMQKTINMNEAFIGSLETEKQKLEREKKKISQAKSKTEENLNGELERRNQKLDAKINEITKVQAQAEEAISGLMDVIQDQEEQIKKLKGTIKEACIAYNDMFVELKISSIEDECRRNRKVFNRADLPEGYLLGAEELLTIENGEGFGIPNNAEERKQLRLAVEERGRRRDIQGTEVPGGMPFVAPQNAVPASNVVDIPLTIKPNRLIKGNVQNNLPKARPIPDQVESDQFNDQFNKH